MIPEPDPEFLALVEAYEHRALSPEEFEARVRAPMSDHEREKLAALIAWFTRRYPTAGDRLRAMEALMRQWQRNRLKRPTP